MINSTDASRAQPPAAGRSGLASPRAAPWRDMTRPTLDEMCYDPMKARPTATRLQRDECLQNITSGKCQKTSDTSSRSHDHTPTRQSKRWPVS